MKIKPKDVKKIFRKCGACSNTFFYIVNREYGQPREIQEFATDTLAGGILREGRQCGMLWGASMAVGAESFRRHGNTAEAVAVTMDTTKRLMESFAKRTKSVECIDITETDFKSKWSFFKYMISAKFRSCFTLAADWAPDAVKTAEEGLSAEPPELDEMPVNCAMEVARKLAATNEEAHMVAGLAGGMGLSGSGCGALGAAIWMNTMKYCEENPGKNAYSNPMADKTIKIFREATGNELECKNICGKKFESIEEHSEYIKSGGCSKIIDALTSIT